MQNTRRDIHSFSNPDQIRVQHLDLDCDVLFDQKILKGTATLSVERQVDRGAPPMILDTRNLHIEKVEVAAEDGPFSQTAFTLGASDPILGAPLTIPMPPAATKVRIQYSTSPEASALQWLDPAQTGRQEAPLSLYAIPGYSRAKLDPTAGYARSAHHVFSARADAERSAGRDVGAERSRRAPQW